jgi:hypothetical protein
MNGDAYQRLDSDLNLYGYPTVYVDGGAEVRVGGTYDTTFYTDAIRQVMHNNVHDLYLSVSLEWLGSAQLQIDVELASNELTNEAPTQPARPDGDTLLFLNDEASYVTSASDLDGDQVWYQWCIDDFCLPWMGPYDSGDTCMMTRTFTQPGVVDLHVKAKDNWDESVESDPLFVTVLEAMCGDPTLDDVVNVSDVVFLIDFVFGQGAEPNPFETGDVNCDQVINVSDVVYMVNFVFGDGTEPCADCP